MATARFSSKVVGLGQEQIAKSVPRKQCHD